VVRIVHLVCNSTIACRHHIQMSGFFYEFGGSLGEWIICRTMRPRRLIGRQKIGGCYTDPPGSEYSQGNVAWSHCTQVRGVFSHGYWRLLFFFSHSSGRTGLRNRRRRIANLRPTPGLEPRYRATDRVIFSHYDSSLLPNTT
jgi:hypothetical protein